MRTVHRVISLFVVVVTLFLGVTGSWIEVIDLHSMLSHAPATDPEMIAMRQEKDGPDEFAVLKSAEYTAPTLPANFDYAGALPKVLIAAHAAFGAAPLTYLEFRADGDKPVGEVLMGTQLLRYDLTRDQAQVYPTPPRRPSVPSTRNVIKHLHRMTTFGDWALWINPIVGIAVCIFVVTGAVMYFRVLLARKRLRRGNWFWTDGGGWWRILHRWVSVIAALFILVIALSGEVLAVESLVFAYYMASHTLPGHSFERVSGVGSLNDTELPKMLMTTVIAYKTSLSERPLKVLRLRVFGNMPQGVIVAGRGEDTQQVVFNAITGRTAGLTEPGYPPTGFLFGWGVHQIAKQVHRGSYFGLSGAWMDLIGGVSIVYLSISGIVMYFNMWQRRRRSGRSGLIWT